ncbi:uncharacterized protein C8Q71DRAFT_715313 [Rhodofomes roseus]|uniref:Fe2OG dioxygenase domain-containing protein n=1 Tax=Rhodofomes roseus TaxID=34475 RepID=A0ABQ8K447_9APHY|nr:uncharacterized protein C8Q71DRAFT_715313 [Rhodofomes roseus]KAH9831433.1 hypothetical protein C8Q71DRAFT_715313 [Rhodofomes roseus]
MSSLEEQLLGLRDCIQNKPPYCSGTLKLPSEDFLLYYGKGDDVRRIDLSTATEESAKHLAESCDSATFGLNNQDVLDESYRKAGKLDRKHFSPAFDLASTGLLGIIETELIERNKESPSIRAELYKLNVYGPGSFFKAHQDTPRSTDMFGSLVVVYPTVHEGGALVLRHGGKEWTFDSSRIIADQKEPRLAYIAFFSDVEHEVLQVQSGYRITITYNLYYNSPQPSDLPVRPLTFESSLKAALQHLLDDPTFLPEGGHLGFCLSHQYPVESDRGAGAKALSEVSGMLKGSDASLASVFTALGLRSRLEFVVEDNEVWIESEEGGSTHMIAYVLFDEYAPDIEETTVESQLFEVLRDIGGKLATRIPPLYPGRNAIEPAVHVHWVVSPSSNTGFKFKTRYLTYGNEALPGMQYTHLCILADVGDSSERRRSWYSRVGARR